MLAFGSDLNFSQLAGVAMTVIFSKAAVGTAAAT
jgi:hypothetical protein